MNIDDLKSRRVAVLGFGMEGKAVISYLVKHGVKPVLFDQKTENDWQKEDVEFLKSFGIESILGPEAFNSLKDFDVAFRSPGIRLSEVKKIAPNIILTSQTKWFFEHCPGKIIGVTGTKGKGTTSSLIYEMLKENQVFLTGNIGKEQPLDFLDKLSKDYWIIYELSSFQLQDLTQSPHIGVVLMVTSEHLDYHENENEYRSAKHAITKYQTDNDFAVINEDYKASVQIGSLGQGRKLYFSRKGETGAGCYIKNGKIEIADSDFKIDISQIQLKGEHNLENICAAALAAHCAGADLNSIQRAVSHFKGLEHRLEFVAEKNNVKFYNDSFSTTPETAIAAINAFSEPLVLILGGSSKNSDFTELAKVVNNAKNIKSIILIGQESDRIKELINSNAQVFEGAKNMEQIFKQIASVTLPGDVVVLSPACASFGMFKNYKDRGEQFKLAVKSYGNS